MKSLSPCVRSLVLYLTPCWGRSAKRGWSLELQAKDEREGESNWITSRAAQAATSGRRVRDNGQKLRHGAGSTSEISKQHLFCHSRRRRFPSLSPEKDGEPASTPATQLGGQSIGGLSHCNGKEQTRKEVTGKHLTLVRPATRLCEQRVQIRAEGQAHGTCSQEENQRNTPQVAEYYVIHIFCATGVSSIRLMALKKTK